MCVLVERSRNSWTLKLKGNHKLRRGTKLELPSPPRLKSTTASTTARDVEGAAGDRAVQAGAMPVGQAFEFWWADDAEWFKGTVVKASDDPCLSTFAHALVWDRVRTRAAIACG